MKVPFAKYHGTGNDFILIDNREMRWTPSAGEIAFLCHRRFGIGADGMMLLNWSPGNDFGMVYFNSDGGESTMCGNGGRCITAFASSLGLVSGHARFIAADGIHESFIRDVNGNTTMVSLLMKETGPGTNLGDGIFIDTGSPHFVVFRDNAGQSDVKGEGRELRESPRFAPGGSNINFVEKRPGGLFVRTYERGVEDETLSCGTGVTAAALVYAWESGLNDGAVTVETPGGILLVRLKRSGERFHDIWLEGPATFVFNGVTEIQTI